MGCGSSKEGSAAIVPLDDRDKDVQVDVGEAGEVSVETNNTSEKINDHAKGKSPLESKVVMMNYIASTELKPSGTGLLDERPLLRMLDLATCAAAEQHAEVPCVTASVLDLVFEPDVVATLGDLLVVTAIPARVGKTSIDVHVTVNCVKHGPGSTARVCSAYFLYVTTRAEDGSKRFVPPLCAKSNEGAWNVLLAKNRRAIAKTEGARKRDPESADNTVSTPPEGDGKVAVAAVTSPSTKVEVLELALPQHMNHMQHNFGGQIMSWMLKAVSVCIGQHVGGARDSHPFTIQLIAIDKLDFVLGSDTADHLTFTAQIVRCFGAEIECKVSVAKKPIHSGKPTVCNVGNMFIAVTPAAGGPPLSIKPVRPTKGVSVEEAEWEDAAYRREHLKIRRQLLSFAGGVVELTEDLAHEASLLCIAMFMRAYRTTEIDWKPVDVSAAASKHNLGGAAAHVAYDCWNTPSMMAIKIVVKLEAAPSAVGSVLDAQESRTMWDPQCIASEVVMPLKVRDPAITAHLYRLEVQFSQQKDAPTVDFSMLHASTINESTGGYVHVSRSVVHNKVPASAAGNVVRGVALPRGFHVAADPDGGNGSEATYLVTVEKEVMKQMLGDDLPIESFLEGSLAMFEKLGKAANNPKEEITSRYNERIKSMASAWEELGNL